MFCANRFVRIDSRFKNQISFKPGLGAYQSLAQKIKVAFSRIFSFFLQFEGFRPISKLAPNPGTHQTPVETHKKKHLFFFRIDLPKNGMAARTGRGSREFQCDWEKTRFAHIWPSASKIGISFANRCARICETLVCESLAH